MKNNMKTTTIILLQALNDDAEMASNGNKNVLPAMGRIVEKLESINHNKKVIATESGYRLVDKDEIKEGK